MPFDWKKAEQEQNQRGQRGTLTVRVVMTSLGVVSRLLHFAIGHPNDLSNGVIPTCVGGWMLAGSLMAQRQRRAAPPPDQ